MSTDKEEFALYCEAKNDKVRKRLGIKGGFYWTTAKKLSVAISRCITAMDDNDYDEDDFKKPVRVHLPVVNDLPPEGVFDTEFCNRYEKGGEDGITMVFIAPSPSVQEKPASTDNTNVNGEDMTEIEEYAPAGFWSGAAHSLACATRQRKTSNARCTGRTSGITYSTGGRTAGCYCPGHFPQHKAARPAGDSRPS
ncbi:hypothetical protein NML53_004852 [Escherichia coli]|nr:hypothetical protein [Escherichia coli]